MNQLIRFGYGNNFNELYTDGKIIFKKSKNNYGNNKIIKEINFYKYLINNNISFSYPEIISFENFGYTMRYLENTIPLYKFININTNRIPFFLNKIYYNLKKLHEQEKNVSYDTLKNDIYNECYTKIINRYTDIQKIVDININRVNGIKVFSFEQIKNKIHNYLNIIIYDYKYCLIHGDLNFNNILLDLNDNETLYYIDPRGYFGNTDIFGIKEYDFAKINFALSGYDNFDSESNSNIKIDNDNILFDMPSIIDITQLIDNSFISFLMITIWLGNAHCFKDNRNKCLKSFYYAIYLSTLYFNIWEKSVKK